MIETLVRLDWEKAGFVCFVTLSYPDRNGPPSLAQTERDRQVFLKRIERLHPGASAIWRREREARKSGEFVGVTFPHYHLMFFGLPFLHYSELNAMWREVLGYAEYVRTEIKRIESWKQALYYVSKYMAKADEGPSPGAGEVRREADTPPGGEARSLVYVTYLTAGEGTSEGQKRESIGRSWGIFNRDSLPWAERKVWRGRAGKWLEVAKHWAKRKWFGIEESENTGFTLFLDDAYKAFEELCSLRKPKP